MTTLLVASGGGHLKQLHRLLPRLDVEADRVWVTFDTALARSLLQDEEVNYAPYAHPHDLRGSLRDLAFASRLLSAKRFDRAVSTGANLAAVFLPFLAMRGTRAEYIESATRYDGPSLTGRMLQRVPRVRLFTQHSRWASARWHYAGSVFDGFRADALPAPAHVRRIVVTLGSNDSYGFARLVQRVTEIVPSDVEVLWQLGSTSVEVPGARRDIPVDELETAMYDADAVIAHAGTGSALSALEAGRLPVLVPRRKTYNEHIDDHQTLTSFQLQSKGLAMSVEADELAWDDVCVAASWRVVDSTDVAPFVLED